MPPGSEPEFDGWTFLDKQFWIKQQQDNHNDCPTCWPPGTGDGMAQGRVNYTNGVNTVADPDAMGGLCCQLLNPDFFDASLSTPAIYLNGVVENTATISFDSSWLNDEIVHPHHDQTSTSHTQTSELQVEFFDANGNLLSVSAKYRSNQTVVVDNEPIPAVVDLERIPAVVDLRNGDTVWVAPGHTAGGEIDQVFRYVGADTSART